MFPLRHQVKATLTVSGESHRTDSVLGSVVLVLDTDSEVLLLKPHRFSES